MCATQLWTSYQRNGPAQSRGRRSDNGTEANIRASDAEIPPPCTVKASPVAECGEWGKVAVNSPEARVGVSADDGSE